MFALFAALCLGGAVGASGYDYVVVGGGVAGSIVATRLAERHSVLLLNIAGPPPEKYNGPVITTDELIVHKNLSATPGMSARIHQPGYKPMPFFSTGLTGSSPARYLGGSSVVGLSQFLYDNKMDWGPGWDWNVMQNYMLKSNIQPTHHPAYLHPLTQDFLKAVPTAQATPTSQRPDGTKITAHAAYIHHASRKLTIMENVRADRLIVDGGVCRGVMVRDLARGGDRIITAEREVIVSAGYLYTPRLLFLSGIGDSNSLAAAGLEVVKDLPAVGKNLTAPRFTTVSWHTNTPTLAQMLGPPICNTAPAVPEAFQSIVAEATMHLDNNAIVQFMPLYYAPASAPLEFSLQGEPWPLRTNAYTMMVTMTTEANGAIEFTKDPDASPIITHEPLTPTDLERGAKAVRATEELASKLPFTGRVEGAQGWSAVYDGRGSCRMGNDPRTSVVDPMLKVHGIEGLRIVDGSVLPSNTPYLAMPEVIMLAERAADLIMDVKTYPVKKDEASLWPDILAEEVTQPTSGAQSTLVLAFGVASCIIAAVWLHLLVRKHSQTISMVQADVYVQA